MTKDHDENNIIHEMISAKTITVEILPLIEYKDKHSE